MSTLLSRKAAQIDLDHVQANYVRNVLRLPDGAQILVFNGRDGEWQAAVTSSRRKQVSLSVGEMTRPQEPHPDLYYLFAPLKHARQDYVVEKAVEMGVGLLRPVLTQRTQTSRINGERMRAHAIEAAEQCGILTIPDIAPAIKLDALLASMGQGPPPCFLRRGCALRRSLGRVAQARAGRQGPRPLAVLIGPEGGFDAKERAALLGLPFVLRLPLGPRILRADTAAVAALALLQATLGDWRG